MLSVTWILELYWWSFWCLSIVLLPYFIYKFNLLPRTFIENYVKVLILCSWYILWQNILHLYLGVDSKIFWSTFKRFFFFSSSIEHMKTAQRNKCEKLKIGGLIPASIKNYEPRYLSVFKLHRSRILKYVFRPMMTMLF